MPGHIVKIRAKTLDPQKLQDEGLTSSQIESVLQANNITLPAGEITSNGQTLSVQVGNTFNSIDDLKNLIVGQHVSTAPTTPTIPAGTGGTQQFPGAGTSNTQQRIGSGTGSLQQPSGQLPQVKSTPVKLSDVATIQETLAPSTSITRTNGKPSIGIAITKTADGNTVSISQAIQDKIPSLESALGHGSKIVAVSDQAPYVRSSVDGLVREGLIGAAFAILVILVFLFSLRSTLVTAISIPLSITITIALLTSLFVALTIIPVLAYWFLKAPKHATKPANGQEKRTILEKGYVPVVRWVTKHRVITILTLLLVPTLYVIVEDIRGRVRRQEPAKPRETEKSSQEEKQQVTAWLHS